jgi:hypothetical protein
MHWINQSVQWNNSNETDMDTGAEKDGWFSGNGFQFYSRGARFEFGGRRLKQLFL